MSRTIWIDADACPGAAKEIVIKAALRTQVMLELVANSYQRLPRSPLVRLTVVDKQFDAADHYILSKLIQHDIVVTADIPFANEVVQKGAYALSPRGEPFTRENIGDRLATRNLLAELRGGELVHGGPPTYGPKDAKKFAEVFDRLLTQALRTGAVGSLADKK